MKAWTAVDFGEQKPMLWTFTSQVVFWKAMLVFNTLNEFENLKLFWFLAFYESCKVCLQHLNNDCNKQLSPEKI